MCRLPLEKESVIKKKDDHMYALYLVICFAASAIAYSATTVFPAEVCAATNTESPISR